MKNFKGPKGKKPRKSKGKSLDGGFKNLYKSTTLLPEFEIIHDTKTGKTTKKFNKDQVAAYRRNLEPMEKDSDGPRNKFARKIGELANQQLSDVISNSKGKGNRPIDINIAIQRGKNRTIAGQSIGNDGKSQYDLEDGPRKGDLIYGRHLKKDKEGFHMDYDYKIKPGKKEGTWKTTGRK